ncbi:hypothetical protein KY339_02900, partial [Candidatus Woesearchaeota archaeon]|nr:hypothetical protein [Candidatus Woesearchaeota archaeon]
MGKRGEILTVFLMLILLANTAGADHNVAPDVNPIMLYETTTAEFNMSIGNFGSQNAINELNLDLNNLEVLDVTEYNGWQNNYSTNTILWYDGSLETNVVLALFQFTAKAPKVDADTTNFLMLLTTDTNNDLQDSIIEVAILNDDSPPVLIEPLPFDGQFVKQGTTEQPVQINATDPETGVAEVSFNWKECTEENESSITLNGLEDVYSGTADLSNYNDSEQVCFYFEAANNGDASSLYEGTLTIDGIPPTVFLISPFDGQFMNSLSEFVFNATDNLAPILACELLVDGNAEETVSANNGELTSVPVENVSEGQHNWQVSCTDQAGWSGTSETRTYYLDRTPPEINLNSPENGSIIKAGTLIDISITDNYDLSDEIWYVFDGNETTAEPEFTIDSSEWPDGPSTIEVFAYDAAGNLAQETFTFVVDRTPPEIELIAPLNSSDVHVSFEFIVTDTYDPILECELYLDDEQIDSGNFTDGELSSFEQLVVPGNYNWSIQCIDDADNLGFSSIVNIDVVDLTGPDITINEIPTVIRANPALIEAEVTDISGVSQVTATITDPNGNTTALTLTEDGIYYTAEYPTTVDSLLGEYVVEITALDTLDNPSDASTNFEVTYGYVVDISLNPSSAKTGNLIEASGNVKFDNGDLVPESEIMLLLPAGNVSVAINASSGDFSHSFNAPGSAGTYDITAQITPENGFTFSDTEALTVSNPSNSGGGDDDGGGSSKKGPAFIYMGDDDDSGELEDECGDNECTGDETWFNCPEDCEAPEEEEEEEQE